MKKETHQCEGITKTSQWNDYQCTRNATVCRAGEWYCRQHDPDAIRDKDMEKHH